MKEIILFVVLVLCLINLIRMSVYLLSSDAYNLRHIQSHKCRLRHCWHLPSISVLVPAHNEEKTIIRNLQSLYDSDYPINKLEVIVVNDGSTDKTRKLITNFKKTHKDRCKFRLINRPNKGKASALNYALRRCARGRLIMCLDADSSLHPMTLRHAAQHFRDRQVVALSSNVNIREDGTMLTLAQRFEYLVCYQMKKGQALLGVEYIVGGIGSMFRHSIMKRVKFYDNNTMTEDIDITMKIINNKTKKQKIAYAADSIVYTESAHSLKELMAQRFRWKYGRTQTYVKNPQMFFSRQKNLTKRISWFMLPFTIIQDLFFFFEPLIVGYFIYVSLRYAYLGIFASALIILTFYLLVNLWASDHLSVKDRLRLTYYAPPMYILMYSLSIAEYFALIKALFNVSKLKASLKHGYTWKSPTRRAVGATQTVN